MQALNAINVCFLKLQRNSKVTLIEQGLIRNAFEFNANGDPQRLQNPFSIQEQRMLLLYDF